MAGSPTAISVLIAENETPLRDALAALVDHEPDLELVGVAADADEAIARARETRPDVALIDVKMPGGGGPRVAGELRDALLETRMIALSAYEDRGSVVDMLNAGAVAYLVKGTAPNEILDAMRRAMRGQASLSEAVLAKVIEELVREASERGREIDARRRSAEQTAALLDSAPDAVVIIDQAGHMVLVNEQTERLFGYERAELLGEPVEMLLPERFRDRHGDHRLDFFSEPRTRPIGVLELAGRRNNGTEFPAAISLSAIDTDEGRLATAFIRDITERRLEQEVRRKSEERFAALLDSAPDAVVIIDAEGRIVLVNEQTEQLFGYARAELLGARVEMLLPPRVHDQHAGHRAGYFADPRTRPMGVGLELAGRKKDGTEFPVDISLSSLETEEGLLATAFIHDMTEREERAELERTLEERRVLLGHLMTGAEEERQRIASDIHDDSIQVITAASMRLQILRRSLDDPGQLAELDELAETIRLSIDRLRHLIFELRPPVLDRDGLAAALRVYLEEAEDQTPTRYKLEDRLSGQPPEEIRLILYRIAQEALANVRKHADARTATVTLAARAGGYFVRIADDGVGFLAERLTAVPGHLGLASMRERAELAGGWLRVASELGAGSTVEFWIPRANGRSVDGLPPEEPESP
jgi:PAS domain S-box-containing protein